MGNGRHNHKFSSPGGILFYCAGADENTCGRKSRGHEKQLIDLEWPNILCNNFLLNNFQTKFNDPVPHYC